MVLPTAWGHSLLLPSPALWFSLWSCQQPHGLPPPQEKRAPSSLFFVFQAQSHIPSQQPALSSHPLIHGNWEGHLEQHSALGQRVWREDISVPSL